MAIEIEIKILDVDTKSLRKQLMSLGLQPVFDGILQNIIFSGLSSSEKEYLRIRGTDGFHPNTITYKKVHEDNITTIEYELEINSTNDAVKLFEAMGLQLRRSDEKHRTRYVIEETIIDIDTWPGIPSYVEIEGTSVEKIQGICQKLGLDFEERFQGTTLDVFRYYGIDPETTTVLRF